MDFPRQIRTSQCTRPSVPISFRVECGSVRHVLLVGNLHQFMKSATFREDLFHHLGFTNTIAPGESEVLTVDPPSHDDPGASGAMLRAWIELSAYISVLKQEGYSKSGYLNVEASAYLNEFIYEFRQFHRLSIDKAYICPSAVHA